MDQVNVWDFFGGGLFMGVMGVFAFVQFAWYVAVIVLLFKIWGRVKHLPTS